MLTLDELNALDIEFVEDDQTGKLHAEKEGISFWLDDKRLTISDGDGSINEQIADGYAAKIIYSRKRLKTKLILALSKLSDDMKTTAAMLEQYQDFDGNAKELVGAAKIASEWANEIIKE